MHCHTGIASVCGRLSPENLVKWYAGLGYSGLCLTDHFSGADPFPGSPWEARVKSYWDAYARTRAAGERLGLTVFWGIEYALAPDPDHFLHTKGTDFLLYNLSKEFLMDNRSIFYSKPADLFQIMRSGGVFVVQAHPFAESAHIESIQLLPRSVDAVETLNGNKKLFENDMARIYAGMYGLPETAGSDCHNAPWPYMCGLQTDAPCSSIMELIAAIRSKQTRMFAIRIYGERRLTSDENVITEDYPAGKI